MNLHDFLDMSGYAAYVWPCYGLTLVVLLWNLWSARRQLQGETVRAKRRAQAQRESQ
jgi:heme exporter protein CcmD